jgi:hypothetical protein
MTAVCMAALSHRRISSLHLLSSARDPAGALR